MASLTWVIVDQATFFRFVIVSWASDYLISISFSSGFQLIHLYALFGLCLIPNGSTRGGTPVLFLVLFSCWYRFICKFAGNGDIICWKLLVCNITCSVITHLQAPPPLPLWLVCYLLLSPNLVAACPVCWLSEKLSERNCMFLLSLHAYIKICVLRFEQIHFIWTCSACNKE